MRKLDLKEKILLGTVPFLAGMSLVSFLATYDIGTIRDSLSRVTQGDLKRARMSEDAIRAMNDLEFAQVSLAHAKTKDAQEKLTDREDAALSVAGKAVAAMDGIDTEGSRAEPGRVRQIFREWVDADIQVRALVMAGKTDAAVDLSMTRGASLRDEFEKVMETDRDGTVGQMRQEADWSAEAYQRSRLWLWVITLIASCFGLGLTMLLVRRISSAIDGIIHELHGNSDALGRASGSLAETSQRTSQGATEQAASLEETAASIEEMSAMIKKNAENSLKSFDVSKQSHEAATLGSQVVEQMIAAIEEIHQSNGEIVKQVEASNREISEIVRVITEIGNKTKVINDIVFQTKLLSFNASVEAARAGEHGKGFAVVAEEVGNLAQMSGKAATEISSMLGSSIEKVQSIINQTQKGVESLVTVGRKKVEAGEVVARRCGEVLGWIVKNVGEVNQRIMEISTASQEQARGIEEINKAIGQLDQVTQNNAAGAEQAARSATELSEQADSLHVAVKNLAAVLQGGSAASGGESGKTAAPGGRSGAGPSLQSGPVPEPMREKVIPIRPVESKVPSRDDARFKDA